MKKFLIVFCLLLININYLFSAESVSFKVNQDKIDIVFKQKPLAYKISYYNFGANLILTGVKINNLIIKKFNSKNIFKILPLSNKKVLLKIQSSIKDLKEHIIISEKETIFKVTILKKINKISQKQNKHPKSFTSLKEDKNEIDKKSIVDVATEYSMIENRKKLKQQQSLSVSKPAGSIKKEKKDVNVNKFDYAEKYDFSKNVVKTYSVLGILCVIIITIALIFRKFRIQNFASSSKLIKILYSQEIIPKKSIVIVKILNEYYILGVTDSTISIVDKISSDSLTEELKLLEKTSEKNKFIKYLKKEEEKEITQSNDKEKEKLIKLIQGKLKAYQSNINI